MKQHILDEIKKIESSVNTLHAEAIRIMQNNKGRQQQLQADEDGVNNRYQQAIHDIEAIKRRIQLSIQEDREAIRDLDAMEGMLPAKLVEECKPQSVTCPSGIDIPYISSLFEKIMTDTMGSAIKRAFGNDGHYKYKTMVKDFLLLSAEAKLFLIKRIQASTADCANQVNARTRMAEDEKRNGENRHSQLAQTLKNNEISETTALVRRRNEFFASDLVVGFSKRVEATLKDCGVLPADWEAYDPKRTRTNKLTIGNMVVPFKTESKSLQKLLIQNIPQHACEGYFRVPYVTELSQPLRAIFRYSEETKQAVAMHIQLLLLRMLRSAPADTFDCFFIDPKDRGNNFRLLNATTEQNEKIGIFSCHSKDEIKVFLKRLEKEIDVTSGLIGSYSSLYEYNEATQAGVKEKIVVIFDFPENMDAESVALLRMLVNNSHRCGVHIILATPGDLAYCKKCFPHTPIDWSFMQNGWLTVESLRTDDSGTLCLPNGNMKYDFDLESITPIHQNFVGLYRQKYTDGLTIDNSFSHVFPNEPAQYKDATNGLSLPVMMRIAKNGGVSDLVIGTSTSTHTLITGNTSSGKSTFLHMIISSIIMNYHPDDVELWLVDYGKVEFNEYYQNIPPHVRFISLEKSEEFTYSFLDYLHEFFSKREKLFELEGVTNIQGYRKKHGKLSMPRVILIVDEFHNMTQHVQQNSNYRKILENALAEYRKFGFSCIFSNQTVSGLQGLTDTARLQIKNRIALSNEIAEMKETLRVGNDNYTDDMLHKMERTAIGELWYKEWTSVSDFSINQFKGIYINDKERAQVLANVCNSGVQVNNDTDVKRINSSERQLIPLEHIQTKVIASMSSRKFDLCLGSPVTVEKMFSFTVEHRYNNNLLLVGRNIKLKRDIIINILLNAYLMRDFNIFIYADERDELFEILQDANYFRSKTCNVKVFTDISKLCFSINKVAELITSKETQRKTLIFWLGLSDLFDEFNVSPRKENVKFENAETKDESAITIDDIELLENDEILMEEAKSLGITVKEMLYNLSGDSQTKAVKENDYSYNACEDVLKIITNGGKFNIHSVIALDGGYDFRKTKGLNGDNFIHKIVLNLPKEDLFELGIRSHNIELEEGMSALYTDGSRFQKFRPYRIKQED